MVAQCRNLLLDPLDGRLNSQQPQPYRTTRLDLGFVELAGRLVGKLHEVAWIRSPTASWAARSQASMIRLNSSSRWYRHEMSLRIDGLSTNKSGTMAYG
jgi:hypothetical protein